MFMRKKPLKFNIPILDAGSILMFNYPMGFEIEISLSVTH